MSKERLVPKLRFAEFINTAEWQKDTLENISQSYSGGTPSIQNSNYYNGSIPFIRSGEIHKSSTKLFVTEEGLDKSSARMVRKGDILYALYGATSGEVSISRIDGAINQAILAIVPNQKNNSNFLEKYLNKEKEYILNSFLQGGQGNLSGKIIRTLNIVHPTIKEQEKIGSFFQNIDQMIQLQQSKVNKVKDIKSAYLSEMFPKEGEKYPKKRFEGFSNEWKDIKMKDIFPTVLSGNRLPKTSLVEGDVPYILATTENNGVYARISKQTLDYHGNKMKLFDTPSISFSIDNPEAIFLQEEEFYTSNIMRVLINPDLTKEEYIFFMEIMRRATGGFDWGVKFSGPVVSDLDIKVPFNKTENKIDYKEVKKIGKFFDYIDKQISIEEEKLEKLEKLKQAYLNDMFV